MYTRDNCAYNNVVDGDEVGIDCEGSVDCPEECECEWIIEMLDGFGNGWQGAFVNLNGAGPFSAAGSFSQVTVPAHGVFVIHGGRCTWCVCVMQNVCVCVCCVRDSIFYVVIIAK